MRLRKCNWLAIVACLAIGACKDDPNSITTLAVLEVGSEECPAGGHAILTGNDGNGNGTLDPGEVSSTSAICSDGDVLLATSHVGAGDASCPFGGTRIDTGFDDGTPSGTPADGALQPGEIDQTQYACNTGYVPTGGTITPPDGPPGEFTIDLGGGDATAGNGGQGGDFSIDFDYGSGGHIKVFSTGVADASFDFPDAVAPELGDVPLVVTANTTIDAVPSGDYTSLSSGDFFLEQATNHIWRRDGATNVQVTGIEVAEGVTLTLEPFAGDVSLTIGVEHDITNAGTIRTGLLVDGRSRAGLQLTCDTFSGLSGSLIDTAGENATAGNPGGNGGNVTLYADDSTWDSYTGYIGAFLNAGDIDSSGGDGDIGGAGGEIYIEAENRIVNIGDLVATGGEGVATLGGDGGSIYLFTFEGDILNSGLADASGGVGAQVGGDADYVYMEIDNFGDVKNGGELRSNGGDVAADCAAGCQGGSGAHFYFTVYGGEFISSGDLSARGGAGLIGVGGDAGYLQIYGYYGDPVGGSYAPTGNLEISGNIDLGGGTGALGGGAGDYFRIDWEADYAPLGQEVILYGYTGIVTDGGDGLNGAEAGSISISQTYSYAESGAYGPSGGIVNYANISARGGSGTAGTGAQGGTVDFDTDYQYANAGSSAIIRSFGDIDMSGGDGTAGGGQSGYLGWYGHSGIWNDGDITARGGNGTSGNASGGSTDNNIELIADIGPVVNTGAITLRGGDASGTGSGGDAYSIEIIGALVDNSGDLELRGGDGHATTGFGGDTSLLLLQSTDETTVNTGALVNAGGSGNTPGVGGDVFVDGVNVNSEL
jgi:hypothetical protein